MAELAPDFTPYRYGFNNPVFWQDATGLFETEAQARAFALDNDIGNYKLEYDRQSKGYTLTIIGGEFDGRSFYDFVEVLPDLLIDIDGSGSGGGRNGGGSNSNSSFGRGELSAMNATSGALAMGELARQAKTYHFFGKTTQQVENALANGKYVHKNGKVYSQKFRGNQYISSQSVKNSLGTAKYLKGAGKLMTGASVGIAAYQFYESDKSGADYARLTGAGIITASAFIPVVGPFISIGLGVADSFGAFDSIYNSFD
ncbi:hypothetical protein SAMN05421741_1513 [Paenimyroides ummariense]|uniref:RHS repeat-associated core domain-containing protein n=2 Tax=Paenimyroides ummariense TaxID=913024 RepID=A0A1I5GVC7_9FLAO|nr:hypothetical protein SAMN05421741_1513 [Paenimyroides ummariense]